MTSTTVTGWLLDTHSLMWMLHGDPFDRMLVCQAKRLGLGIISVDKIIETYQISRAW